MLVVNPTPATLRGTLLRVWMRYIRTLVHRSPASVHLSISRPVTRTQIHLGTLLLRLLITCSRGDFAYKSREHAGC